MEKPIDFMQIIKLDFHIYIKPNIKKVETQRIAPLQIIQFQAIIPSAKP